MVFHWRLSDSKSQVSRIIIIIIIIHYLLLSPGYNYLSRSEGESSDNYS